MGDFHLPGYMYLLKRGRDGVVSRVEEEESCDEVVIDLRGSCPREVQESGFEDGVNVVYTYSSICRPCNLGQLLSRLCMVRALYS